MWNHELKKMCIYKLHRDSERDHENGRPAILLKHKSKTSLVWWGTHKRDIKSPYEKPVIIKLNGVNTYFYVKGIEKVNNPDIKNNWVDLQNNDIYELNDLEQKELIKKFVKFTNQKDPYEQINKLELKNQILEKENEELKMENQLLQQKEDVVQEEELEDEYEYGCE